MERQKKIKSAIQAIDDVCEKILQKKAYQLEMQTCVQEVNTVCIMLLQEAPENCNILQILQDMMYGMTQRDEVFLLDVLRFGLKAELENNEAEGLYE